MEICADGSLEEVEGKLLDIVNKELVKERGAVSRLWQVLSCVTYAFFYVDTLGVQDRGGGVIIEVRSSPAARSENIFHYFVLFVMTLRQIIFFIKYLVKRRIILFSTMENDKIAVVYV